MAARSDILQNAAVPLPLPGSRLSQIAMAAAVAAVFALAYLDLERDQAQSFEDFAGEQQRLATVAAAVIQPAVDQATGARPDAATARLAELQAMLPQAPARWLLQEDGGRVWLIDETGRVAPSSTTLSATELGSLRAQMAALQPGALRLSRDAADALGLERRVAVAGHAPILVQGAPRWSIAVVTSAKRVRDRERVGAVRLIAATGFAALLVGLFGLITLRQQRREHALAAALRQAEAAAALRRAEKLATIGTLAAGMAHEIGTPLGIISGRAEQVLLRLGTPDSTDAARKGLTSILAQVEKVSGTIRQLLDFARVRPVEARALAPAALFEGLAGLLDHRFAQGKVRLTVELPLTLPPISGDPAQLEQVFVNLLLNAADACAPGGHVKVGAVVEGARLVFAIADDGCGIPPEHTSAVFDPFFTTKKRGQGTGLGLPIAADIVKNHGGTLELDSEPGQGTTVRVGLPIAAGA